MNNIGDYVKEGKAVIVSRNNIEVSGNNVVVITTKVFVGESKVKKVEVKVVYKEGSIGKLMEGGDAVIIVPTPQQKDSYTPFRVHRIPISEPSGGVSNIIIR